eukprot:m.90486 g.90486  ORF g.90486 m.90486 type:complete len:53 (-) comp8850_c1_seq25:1684-1842(-)
MRTCSSDECSQFTSFGSHRINMGMLEKKTTTTNQQQKSIGDDEKRMRKVVCH